MPKNDPGERAIDFLGHCLNRVALDIRVATADALKPLGISPRQLGLILELNSSHAHNQLSLAATLRIDRAALVAILDELEAKHILQRRKDREDRRNNSVLLTEKGRALVKKALPLARAAENQVMAALTSAERDTLRQLLSKVVGLGDLALQNASETSC